MSWFSRNPASKTVVAIRITCKGEGWALLQILAEMYQLSGKNPDITYVGQGVVLKLAREISQAKFDEMLAKYGKDIEIEPVIK
jgi:hypothetical protein